MFWINEKMATASVFEASFFPEKAAVITVVHLSEFWNPPEVIYQTIKAILPYLHNFPKTIICCAGGINRSNAVATTIIAFTENLAWDDAYTIVKKKVPVANVTYELKKACEEALNLLRKKLTKRCPICQAPIEEWETRCALCWHKK